MAAPGPRMASVVSVPGRVNLIGDHTDYNGGLALPMAIDRWCTVTAVPGDEAVVRARSAQLDGVVEVPLTDDVDPRTVEPSWGRFVAGTVAAARSRGRRVVGADLSISSTVPPGAGLSSSSALAVALVLTLAPDSAGDASDCATIALDAEVRATGVFGGLMDQLVALAGRRDHALLLDFEDVDDVAMTPVPLPAEVAVLVVHCGKARTLAGTEYAVRRSECEAIARRLGLPSLRGATAAEVAGDPRARHVVSENARVLAMRDACQVGDLARMGELMLASHASLRDDYEVSTPELDVLAESLVSSGAAGARLTGAGFGGCVVAVCARAGAAEVLTAASARYRAATGIEPSGFVARAVDGALAATTPA